MRLDPAQSRRRLLAEPALRLGTSGSDAQPHIVPVTFANDGDVIYVAVDHKPKTTTALRRLRNIRENPQVCFLADHYDDDWSRLWWVRADAIARVVDGATEHSRAVELLSERYRQYRTDPPTGPVVRAEVVAWSGWQSAADPPGTDEEAGTGP